MKNNQNAFMAHMAEMSEQHLRYLLFIESDRLLSISPDHPSTLKFKNDSLNSKVNLKTVFINGTYNLELTFSYEGGPGDLRYTVTRSFAELAKQLNETRYFPDLLHRPLYQIRDIDSVDGTVNICLDQDVVLDP